MLGKRLITDALGDEHNHIETRHDYMIDRNLWHFGQRRLAVQDVEIKPKEI